MAVRVAVIVAILDTAAIITHKIIYIATEIIEFIHHIKP